MSAKFITPGVYIEEMSAFPNSVVQVETAIPAFIGYTEKAIRNGKSQVNKPVRVKSLNDYIEIFGGKFKPQFNLDKKSTDQTKLDKHVFTINGEKMSIEYIDGHELYMFNCIRLFYSNGGKACYIVSVDTYEGNKSPTITKKDLLAGLETLKKENEPTMIVIPDAVVLPFDQCYTIYKEVLKHCAEIQSRVAILDVHNGFLNRVKGADDDVIDSFRDYIGSENLNYGAAYYPWLNTDIIQKSEISLENITLDLSVLVEVIPEINAIAFIEEYLSDIDENKKQDLHLNLMTTSPTYALIIDEIYMLINLLPPSSAMAGLYTTVDNSRGVWKAPANVRVSRVIKPSVIITHDDQENLNVDAVSGKSINAIRTFPGVGTLVWGARTLDGNSMDWRYINVRRTVIMLEQSIKLALRSYVFEPNDANTWITVKSMIENFLTQKWKQGALAGTSTKDAFYVQVGLGTTMTSLDILEGRMLVSVGLAIVRPAEFIIVTFEQKMQKP
ncbi:MAG: phage tail sheath C-terminal domain-containing protein [Urechidicola sp.]|nr:phage tail sheath C-terminal domain-containing protein [Urechidicola sp.]